MPGLSVVIPAWNSRADLARCLPSLFAQTQPPADIHIIDNGSSDGTVDWLRAAYPQIDVVSWPENRGFSTACNEGVRRAQSEYLLILNADTWLDARCFERLLSAAMRHPGCSLAPKILRADGIHIDSTGLLLRRRRFSPKDRGEGEEDRRQYDDDVEIFGPTGAAGFYPKSVLQSAMVEGEVFDESFFAYYEDVDLAWRLQLLGCRSYFVPDAIVHHDRKGPGRPCGPLFARAYANRYLYFIKNATWLDWLLDLPCVKVVEAIRLLRLRMRSPDAFAYWPLVKSSWRAAWRKRRQVQRLRRVSVWRLRRF
ncbi:glycosyltransferase family 2 protein [bacterium]|nr:glycosyltransferase family 2 protein [bacterium]